MCTITINVPEIRAFNPEPHGWGFFIPGGWLVWVFRVVMILFFIFLWGGLGSRGPIGG
jgi:hypothetical protein